MNKKESNNEKDKPKKSKVDPRIRLGTFSVQDRESQVIVKCSYKANNECETIRISKSTMLVAHGYNLHRSRLIYTHNISSYPEWTLLKAGAIFHFTLIFTCLPKNCKSFDLVENVTSTGAIIIKDIQRNDTDIYTLHIANEI